jgi:RimJ/RimL family protein N-acetyltransferase
MSLFEQPIARRRGSFAAEEGPNDCDGEQSEARLASFRPEHAREIASWVRSARELQWVAPNTPPPLTASKIAAWRKAGGQALVLLPHGGRRPLAYGELNPMQAGAAHWWLGHVVVRPDQRRRGIGLRLLQLMLAEAFEGQGAQRVSLIVFPDNLAAIRCYQRSGFTKKAEEFHRFATGKTLHRLGRMEVDRAAWEAQELALSASAP